MMKRLAVFILLFLLILLSSAVSAYDLPEGYHVVNESDNYTLMESDNYHSISICTMDNNTNKELLKYLLEQSMYDFTYQDNYTKGSFDIEENYYNQEYQRGILYLCDDGEELVVIDYKVPVIEELEDSPVDEILDDLSKGF